MVEDMGPRVMVLEVELAASTWIQENNLETLNLPLTNHTIQLIYRNKRIINVLGVWPDEEVFILRIFYLIFYINLLLIHGIISATRV